MEARQNRGELGDEADAHASYDHGPDLFLALAAIDFLQIDLVLLEEIIPIGVAAKNLIQLEMTLELANHVIIPGHAGNDRTARALAVVAGEVAPPARS